MKKLLLFPIAVLVIWTLLGCELTYNRDVTYEYSGGQGSLIYYLGGENAVQIDEHSELNDYWDENNNVWSRTFKAKTGDLLMLRIHKDRNTDEITMRIIVDGETIEEETTSYGMAAYIWTICP